MIIVYCDKCKEKIELWRVRVISNKWKDDSGKEIAEICDKCLVELEKWLGKPRKPWETGYKHEKKAQRK